MLFSKRKQKPKIDPKIRFQHAQFAKKLVQAKEYKRLPRQIPENALGKFLVGIGLASWWSRIGVVLGVALLVYLVWVPNFLYADRISVQGVDGPIADSIKSLANTYLQNTRKGLLPQKNMIFLDTADLQNYITSHNELVLRISGIQKKYFGQIVITGVAKTERYVIGTQKGVYVLFNDGSFSREFSADANTFTTALPGLVKIKMEVPVRLTTQSPIVDPRTLKVIEVLQRQFGDATKNQVDYFEIPVVNVPILSGQTLATVTVPTTPPSEDEAVAMESINQQTVVVWGRKAAGTPHQEFKVLIDRDADTQDMLARLSLLFSQMAPDRYQALVYIDFRLKQRAFICLFGTPCSYHDSAPPPIITPQTPPTVTTATPSVPTPSPTPQKK